MKSTTERLSETNTLFPVFIKLENLRIVIVGGGSVALEKLQALVRNSPGTAITVVAIQFLDRLKALSVKHRNVTLIEKKFKDTDLNQADLVFSAVNDLKTTSQIRRAAKKRKLLINAADKPDLCDFYLGSIVRKGNLKVAISTNGKSPTLARRLKEVLNSALPEQLDRTLDNLFVIRNQLKGDLAGKVRRLNKITSLLAQKTSRKKRN